jgi:hypothetical protein
MAKLAKVNTRSLEKFKRNMNKLNSPQKTEFTEEALKELAAGLLWKVKELTPEYNSIPGDVNAHVGGQLRDNWEISAVTKTGSTYEITIFNNVEYAPYVEFGHRGVYVPKLGKTLHKDTAFTKGKFMLTISAEELEADAPRILENKLNRFVKEVLSGA